MIVRPPDDRGFPIAILTDQLFGGGVERVVSYQSRALLTRPGDVIFAFDASRVEFEFVGQLVSLQSRIPPYRNVTEELWRLAQSALHLYRAKHLHQPHICISHKEGPNIVNVLTRRKERIIVTVHEPKSSGIKYHGVKRWLAKAVIGLLYNRADHIVTVSHGIAYDLAANFGIDRKRITVIHNPCDTRMIAAQCTEKVEPEYSDLLLGPLVVTIGRLDFPKGHWHLVRAFALVRQRVSGARLLIIGAGENQAYIEDLARQLGLADSVHLLGFQRNPFKFLQHADVFVLSSLWEGFGAVIPEAMACGVPVVSTDCPSGPSEILSRDGSASRQPVTDVTFAEYGILTPPLDGVYRCAAEPAIDAEQKLAEALTRLLEDEPLRERYRAAGRLRVHDFDTDVFADRWHQLVRDL